MSRKVSMSKVVTSFVLAFIVELVLTRLITTITTHNLFGVPITIPWGSERSFGSDMIALFVLNVLITTLPYFLINLYWGRVAAVIAGAAAVVNGFISFGSYLQFGFGLQKSIGFPIPITDATNLYTMPLIIWFNCIILGILFAFCYFRFMNRHR